MYIRWAIFLLSVCCCSNLSGQKDKQAKLAEAQQLSRTGSYEQAAVLFKEIADYWQTQGQQDSTFFYLYREASHYGNAYQFEKAEKLLIDLIHRAEGQTILPDFMGRVYYRLGSNFVFLNNFESAFEYLNKCLDFEKGRPQPDSLYIAKAIEWKGLTFKYTGDLEKARVLVEEALVLRKKVLGKRASEVGYNLNSLALIFSELNQLEKADSLYTEALQILSEHLPASHAHLSSIRSNISTIKSTQGDFHGAKSLLEESITAHLAEKRFYPLMDDYFNLGTLYLSLDDSEHALPYINRALELVDSLLPSPHYTRSNMLDGLGGIYYSDGKYRQADSIFRLSLNEKSQLFEPGHPEIGRSYYSLGLIAKETGQLDLSKEYYLKSLASRSQVLGPEHPATADVVYGLAELEWSAGRHEAAVRKFRSCLNIYEKNLGINNQSFIQTALRTAVLFHETHQPDSVEWYLQRSWEGVLEPPSGEWTWSALSENPIQFIDSYVFYLIAFHLQYLYDQDEFSEKALHQSRQLLSLMDQLLQKMLPIVEFENKNRQQVHSIQQIYRLGAALMEKGTSIHPGDPELQNLMLYCLDQSRSITIRSALQNRQALSFAAVPEEVIEEDRQLRERMRFLKARMGEHDELEERYFDCLEDWRTFQQDLQSTYPDWFQLRYDRTSPTKEEVVARLEEDNRTLLIYFDLDTSLLALLVDGHSFQQYVLPVQRSWADSVLTYQHLIETRAAPQRIASLGYFLYQSLWEPLKQNLKEKVVIVPDGPLFYLNFESLLSDLPQNNTYSDWPWLIKDHVIHYSNQLPVASSEERASFDNILAVAPAFKNDLKQNYLADLPAGESPDSLFLSWLRTPWSADFARQIGTHGKALIGSDATKSSFLEYASKAGILHLGTHAMLKDEDPLLSFFALSPDPRSTESSYLYAYELYNLPLQAKLSVLTACQTGLGEYRRGEGVLSLAHAFQYAGCPSVVYSLWSIDDQQSNLLMTSFYDNMDNGIPFSEALRQAKLDYLQDQSGVLASPFYWAGLVLIGENDRFDPPSSVFENYWWLGLVILALGLLSVYFFRKK